MRLCDLEKLGHRRYLKIYLVDPEVRIRSTTRNVPP